MAPLSANSCGVPCFSAPSVRSHALLRRAHTHPQSRPHIPILCHCPDHTARHRTLYHHTPHRQAHQLPQRVCQESRRRHPPRPRTRAQPTRRRTRRHLTYHHTAILETTPQRRRQATPQTPTNPKRRPRAQDPRSKHPRLSRKHPGPPRHVRRHTPALSHTLLRPKPAHEQATPRHGPVDKA